MNPNSYIGRTLDGRFRIDEPLAAGGMGAVFRATQLSVNRQVALKVIAPHLLQDDESVARLLREAEALSAIRHPNVVSLVDFGTDDGTTYLVMEMVDGKSLRDLLVGDVGRSFTMELLRQITSALAAVHDAGIVHRDLKPDNIMVSRLANGRMHATLVDFGIVRVPDVRTLTDAGVAIGTPQYMSPEQAYARDVGPSSDLFSLGIIAYELICGSVPWSGANALRVVTSICKDPHPPLHAPTWPEALVDLVDRMLQKEPADRPQSASTLHAELEQIARRGRLTPSAADLMDLPVTSTIIAVVDEPNLETDTVGPGVLSSAPSRVIPALIIAAAILVVGAGLALRPNTHPEIEPAVTTPQPEIVVTALAAEPDLGLTADAAATAPQEREVAHSERGKPQPAARKPKHRKRTPAKKKPQPKPEEAPAPPGEFGLKVTPEDL